jgi:molybdopterin molybdotransferase
LTAKQSGIIAPKLPGAFYRLFRSFYYSENAELKRLSGLLSVSEARQILLDALEPVGVEWVGLAKAAGRILAGDILARFDLPPFSNSSMDGFAVLSGDVQKAGAESPVTLNVIDDIPAGQAGTGMLQHGQAVRIMTGAPLPSGAEAVVPVEETDFGVRGPGLGAPEQVRIYHPAKAGENVRPQGQDVRAGERVLTAQTYLRAQEVGFLAMLGEAQVKVYRRPRIGLISTGDELMPVEERLEPGKIHDSNVYILAALVEKYGGESFNLGIAADRQESVMEVLERAYQADVDLILSSAGVSVGAFDFVRKVVEEHGELSFWRVNMRPGKPLAFGHYRKKSFIGLPGNPVSSFVAFEVFVRPALLKMSGFSELGRASQTVRLAKAIESDGRESYLRSIVTHEAGIWTARLTGHQGSGNLRSLVQANALLIVPSGVKSLPAGAELEAWMFDGF